MRLVMNPGSRSGRGRRLWNDWETGLRAAGIVVEPVVTRDPDEAFRASAQPGDADVVVAVGGDGTINRVLDGVIQSGRPALRMGVLYCGTSPDFCRFHGIPTEPARALDVLVRGQDRKVDVVRIEYAGPDGSGMTAHFGCGCNIGLGPAVAGFSNRVRHWAGDGLGTGLAVIRALALSAPVDLDLEIDGRKHSLARVNNLSVLKNPYIASGLKLNVDLRSDDGRLRVVAVHGRSPVGLCALLPRFYTGSAITSSGVFVRDCAQVNVTSDNGAGVEFDGDPRGRLPVRMRVLPRTLNLIGTNP